MTSCGAPRETKTAREVWLQAWNELSQEKIQQWIEQIPHHIQEIIRLEGGNEYREGGYKGPREYKGQRLKGKISKQQDLGRDCLASRLEAAETLAALHLGDMNTWEDVQEEE
ncbi:hypothetical protein CIHG_02829 [Coccidioides immitis H538.4]|uniref:Uncharacterized protein n=2 Tax=Coccidioides immitis TaxID=5501 RepID=A0A0J8RJN2_COCIT|nr:hypothetical protein CIRG_07541 [Coccidioides immitis RMSCC 2394]KMU85047.1 hypothetical protein CIHG_02829 [Coccidioides immitis H538.4]